MGVYQSNFTPSIGASALVTVGASSVATTLPGPAPGDTEQTYRLTNDGPQSVHFAFGTGSTTVAADGTAVFLRAGQSQVFDVPRGATHIATILDAAGSARLFITRGLGT